MFWPFWVMLYSLASVVSQEFWYSAVNRKHINITNRNLFCFVRVSISLQFCQCLLTIVGLQMRLFSVQELNHKWQFMIMTKDREGSDQRKLVATIYRMKQMLKGSWNFHFCLLSFCTLTSTSSYVSLHSCLHGVFISRATLWKSPARFYWQPYAKVPHVSASASCICLLLTPFPPEERNIQSISVIRPAVLAGEIGPYKQIGPVSSTLVERESKYTIS